MSDIRESRSGPIGWMASNPVAANLLMALLIVGGLLMVTQVKQEVFPEYDDDTITIEISYPGASPSEIERGVVLAIESATRGLTGVDEVTSEIEEGAAEVTLGVDSSANYQRLYQNVQQAVDGLTTLPDDADRPVVEANDWRRDVLDMQIHGDVPRASLRAAAESARESLLAQDGVSQVGLEGVREPRVFIDVSETALREHGLTLSEVSETVRANALDRSAGNLKTENGELLVRLNERKDWAAEFARLPLVAGPDGAVVRLGDVAEVRDGFADSREEAVLDGEPAIGIEVFRVGSETPLGVSEAVQEALPGIERELPEAIDISIQDNAADTYGQRVQLLLKNGVIGLALVLVLLSLFLEFKLAVWVSVGILTSFVGTFLFMPALGLSLSMISLFAFILAIGIVVDDAIVAGENIYEHRARGAGPIDAAIRGARDIAVPISFSVLTNVVAFMPLAFVPGGFGQLWAVIPAIVVTALLISWFEALLIMPAHLGHVRSATARRRVGARLHALQERFSAGFERFVRDVYGPFLARAVRARYLTVSISLAILVVVVAIPASGRMGFVLIPEVESSVAEARATMSAGASESARARVRDRMIRAAETVIADHGGDKLGDGTYAVIEGPTVEVRAYLTGPDVRPMGTTEFVGLWREELGQLPGVRFVRFSSQGGPGGGPSLSVNLSHPEVATLERAARDFASRLGEFPVVSDIDDGTSSGKPRLDVSLTDRGRAAGFAAEGLAAQIRGRVTGLDALKQQRGRNEVTAVVRYPESERDAVRNLSDSVVVAPDGGEYPFSEVARIERDRAASEITRRDGRRTTAVTANVTPIEATSRVTGTLRRETLPTLAADYPGLEYGFDGRQESMREAVTSFYFTVSVALFVVFALLAVPLKSYVKPLIVMTAIPFGVVGAILGHLLMGYPLSIISVMGMIALGGVVVNGALVMIDYANRKISEGASPSEAIHLAGVRRFRPIVLTTLTTFGGLAPMIFETSRQARFLIPMALSLGYGILFASAILLLLTPCLYMILEDAKAGLRRLGFGQG